MTLQEKLNEWYLYWMTPTYCTGARWRQKEFSKLVMADKKGEAYY